jgi:hypothetical protein
MPKRNMIFAAVFLTATIIPSHFHHASAESVVKTKAQCTRYGGRVSRNTGPMSSTHPWTCDTPARDRQCMKRLGNAGYFDAEFGKCMKMTDEELDCYIFDDCW